MALSLEAHILFSTAGGPDADGRIRALLEGGGESVDWRKLIAMSFAEGAQPILFRRIREVAADTLPRETEESFRQIERTAEFRLAYLQRRLMQALDALSREGIPVLLLKGAAVAHSVYGSIRERPMADVDLLVEPGRAKEARALLVAGGWTQRYPSEFDGWYATMHHAPPLVDARVPGLEVGLDLHTDLFSEESNPFRLSTVDLWREARPVPGLPPGIFVPGDTHQLLHCCLHYAWSHQLSGAAWRSYRDVSAICRQRSVDWGDFVAAAERSHGSACCYWTLRLARSLAGAPVPDGVLARLRPRVPQPVLDLLERHFSHEAALAEQVCPSIRIRKVIWKAAVTPHPWRRVTGHANAPRPWHLLRTSGPSNLPARPNDEVRPALSPTAWARYFRAIV